MVSILWATPKAVLVGAFSDGISFSDSLFCIMKNPPIHGPVRLSNDDDLFRIEKLMM
jgi:hypothetical protein